MKRNAHTTVVLAAALMLLASGTASATTITGTTSNLGGHDTWNFAGNWDMGVPSGSANAVVAAGVLAEAWNDSTPTYSGGLTLMPNSTLQTGWTTLRSNSINALGSSTVTMHDGTQIRLRMPENLNIANNFELSGDASIHLSPSTSAHHRTREFDSAFSGPGALTLIGNNNNTGILDAANTFDGFTADADDSWRVDAEVDGALGMGDVTINGRSNGDPARGATLRINASNTIADSAALHLNGGRDHRLASKLILNQTEVVSAFFVDGVDQGAGTFNAALGLTTANGDPLISGPGDLIVTGGGPAPPMPVTILSTDFAGRTVAGATASSIPWLTNGVADPGDLTAVDINNAAPGTFQLFDTPNSQGHFAPDLNVANEGPWEVDIPIALEGGPVEIQQVVLDWQHFNNGGAFQSAGINRPLDWTVELIGQVAGLVDSETVNTGSGGFGETTLDFGSVFLTADQDWIMRIRAVSTTTTGNNTGLDGINVIGIVSEAAVPEPATATLALLGIAGLAMRRRRRAAA